jgi:pimeloyl-ACP methyl ester carboxylesterase
MTTYPRASARVLPVALGSTLLFGSVMVGVAPVSASPDSPPAEIDWQPCEQNAELECGTLNVPLSYVDEEGGATVPIAVLRVPARNQDEKIGSLVINPGGPGGSGVDFAAESADSDAFSAAIRDRYDIVGFDPRGVDRSQGVVCSAPEAPPAAARSWGPFTPPPSGEEQAAAIAAAEATAARCSANSDPDFPANVTTENVARDMDVLREALGEDQLDFFGTSYGTYLGAVYASLFPDNVDKMVLDGSIDPNLYVNQPGLDDALTALGAAQTLQAYFDTCRTEGPEVCPVGNGEPEAGFDAVVAKLSAEPVSLTLPDGSVFTIGGPDLIEISRLLIISPSSWGILTSVLSGLEQGDLGPLADVLVALLGQMNAGPESGALSATSCNDRDYQRGDVDTIDQVNAAISFLSPRLASAEFNPFLECSFWPVTAAPERYAGPFSYDGENPVLVVGGTIDSQTGYYGAIGLTEQLGNARLLTFDGVGHVSYRSRNGECIVNTVDAYLLDGAVPEEGAVCGQPPITTAPPAGDATTAAAEVMDMPAVDAEITEQLELMSIRS